MTHDRSDCWVRADRSLAIALLLLAYGQDGLASWVDAGIGAMMAVAEALHGRDDVEVFNSPVSGVLLWRPLLKRTLMRSWSGSGRKVAGPGFADGRKVGTPSGSNPLMNVHELIRAHQRRTRRPLRWSPRPIPIARLKCRLTPADRPSRVEHEFE